MEIPLLLCAAGKSGIAAVVTAGVLQPSPEVALGSHATPQVVVSAVGGAGGMGGEQSAASLGLTTTVPGHNSGIDMGGAASAPGSLSAPPPSDSLVLTKTMPGHHSGIDMGGAASAPGSLSAPPTSPSDFLGSVKPTAFLAPPATASPAGDIAASSAGNAAMPADVAFVSPPTTAAPVYDRAVWDTLNSMDPASFNELCNASARETARMVHESLAQ